MQTILVVEDKKSMSDMLTRTLQSEGYAVRAAFTVRDGIVALASGETDAVITDLRLPDGDGMEVLKAVQESSLLTPVIVMTAFGSIEIAVRAVKEGAYDFITKPFDPDHLLLIIKRALEERSVQKENLILKKEFSRFLKRPEIIGTSGLWQEVMEKVRRVAPLKTTVLILGESGTGKELIARAIHYLSPRGKESFVAVNCAAVPPDLIENELFGHEKGAFTGALEIKPGRFELANRGTIFLDEIGDMAMPLQSKLLRVLQENEFERVGGAKTIKADLRVIAASNKDLEKEVSDGNFRDDLFYRLNVFPVIIPPLRKRKEDVIPVAEYFISLFSKEMSKNAPSLSPETGGMLLCNEWKGNVRELKNVVERAVILCDGPVLLPEHFNFTRNISKEEAAPDASLHEVAQKAVRFAEKERIENALKQTVGNKSRAAELLKVSYKTLLTKIKEYGIY
ncbi:MAG: sigma-54 dependent transcriptional regulator [Nitrospirae bacterium]|nr:sigma-54 dependent transcriptional regulator [Nitrospirota bacterium]MCL5238728.1 sigma-54 dependent transcriptional regulator [Nitrospirota bacterium]